MAIGTENGIGNLFSLLTNIFGKYINEFFLQ